MLFSRLRSRVQGKPVSRNHQISSGFPVFSRRVDGRGIVAASVFFGFVRPFWWPETRGTSRHSYDLFLIDFGTLLELLLRPKFIKELSFFWAEKRSKTNTFLAPNDLQNLSKCWPKFYQNSTLDSLGPFFRPQALPSRPPAPKITENPLFPWKLGRK